MLSITGIKKGIVIDHIPSGYAMVIFDYLNLEEAKYSVALIMNVCSNKMGKKDIIKIENDVNIDLSILGIISTDITINIIDKEKIIKKYNPEIPMIINNVIKCKNPRCVTSVENNILNKFNLINEEKKEYSCEYCEDIIVVDKL